MGKITFLFILLIAIGLVLKAQVPPLRTIENIHLKEAKFHYELIKEYEFERALSYVHFTKPELTDSGTLSFAELRNETSEGRFNSILPVVRYAFDRNLSPIRVGNDSLSIMVSPHGEYFVQTKLNRENPVSTWLTHSLYNKSGTLFWEKEADRSYAQVTDKGTCFFGIGDYRMALIKRDGTIKETKETIYNDASKQYLIYDEYRNTGSLSQNGNFAMVYTENNMLGKEFYHSFPLGSRVFFYDEQANFIKSYDIEGVDVSSPVVYSNSGEYFVMQSPPYMYLFKDTELILKADVKRLYSVRFSEDESAMLAGTEMGALIFDMNTLEIVDNFSMAGGLKTIANLDYPIVASMTTNEVYVVNYETGEVILSEIIGPKFPRRSGVNYIELSGEGKMLSVFHYKWFRKYRIGERK